MTWFFLLSFFLPSGSTLDVRIGGFSTQALCELSRAQVTSNHLTGSSSIACQPEAAAR